MNKNELKEVLKPLIKQCIKEVILEEGVLSNVISEVVKGLGANSTPIVETKTEKVSYAESKKRTKKALNETKSKMLDAIGKDTYGGVDIFEGTNPLRSGGNPNAGTSPSDPLAGYEPDDEGVNINGILQVANGKWNKLIGK